MMKIATWNLNSVRTRERRLLRWLAREAPDVLCLQELKVVTDEFPFDAVRRAGYHAVAYGQKGLNGVAILSREKPDREERGMGPDDADPQARLVRADFGGLRVLSAYFPAGLSVGSREFHYKLEWMERLRLHLEATAAPYEPLVLAGDFNVAPDDSDVANPDWWGGSVLCHQSVRDALERLRAWGLIDVVRKCHPDGGIHSWWDYQMRAFERGDGLRIDHIFATKPLASRSITAHIDRDERKGTPADKPSDHAPVIAEFDL